MNNSSPNDRILSIETSLSRYPKVDSGFFLSIVTIAAPVFSANSFSLYLGDKLIVHFPKDDISPPIALQQSDLQESAYGSFHFVTGFSQLATEDIRQRWLSLIKAAIDFCSLAHVSTDEDMSICPSLAMELPMLQRYAESTATIFISGESGTGKTFLARLIHQLGHNTSPAMTISLSAIPDSLLDIELFGHSKGAFTDATTDRAGKLTQVGQGTLILEGIDDISQEAQFKLESVLQNRLYYPIGSNTALHLQARLIVIAKKSGQELVESGKLRPELFYLLNVLPLNMRNLNERQDDIPFFVSKFLDKSGSAVTKKYTYDQSFIEQLKHKNWRGNLHELHNLLENLRVQSDDGVLTFPKSLPNNELVQKDLKVSVNQYKKKLIHDILRECNGNQTKAAKALGIQRTYLSRLIKELSIPL